MRHHRPFLLLALFACPGAPFDGGKDRSDTDPSAETDVVDTDIDIDTELPPDDHSLPDALRDALPTTPDGLPLLLQGPAELPGGAVVQLGYDETLDDPITRWAACLGRVARCYEQQGVDLDTCVARLPRCTDAGGGEGCCPSACTEAYAGLRSQGTDEDAAVDATFVEGSCVAGYTAFRDAAGGPFLGGE